MIVKSILLLGFGDTDKEANIIVYVLFLHCVFDW